MVLLAYLDNCSSYFGFNLIGIGIAVAVVDLSDGVEHLARCLALKLLVLFKADDDRGDPDGKPRAGRGRLCGVAIYLLAR